MLLITWFLIEPLVIGDHVRNNPGRALVAVQLVYVAAVAWLK